MCCVHEKTEEDLLEQGARKFHPLQHQVRVVVAHEKSLSVHFVPQIYKERLFFSPFPTMAIKSLKIT